MTTQWKLVDQFGAVVMTAESITKFAEMQGLTPAQLARSEARNLSDPISGKVFAVKI